VCGFSAPSNAEATGKFRMKIVLFAFDDYWIPFRQSLTLALVPPKLCEQNPVFAQGRRRRTRQLVCFAVRHGYTTGQQNSGCGTVRLITGMNFIRAGQTCGLAYAESTDGVRWKKPKLGLRRVSRQQGNNLCALDRECYNSPLVLV